MPCCDMQIAIMGCIVNGPGEMADADFGYVGGAPGKIDLYVGKVTPLVLDASFLLSIHRGRVDATKSFLSSFSLKPCI